MQYPGVYRRTTLSFFMACRRRSMEHDLLRERGSGALPI